jgi:hypothetical protein
MLRRLLLALLTICLAVPAMAAPTHCLPQPIAAMAMHHSHHGEHKQAPQPVSATHDCIGCIAPYAGIPPMASAPPRLGMTAPPLAIVWAMPSLAAPDTPPPRT